jgi:hypothetical protein
MDFFDDLQDDEPGEDELSDDASAESGDDDAIADDSDLSEFEFVELPDSGMPDETLSPIIDWPDRADGPRPVPMPGARGPAFDFSMLVGSGFGDGFAEIPRPRQPRVLPFSPPADSGVPQRRDYDLLFRFGEHRGGIEQLPLRPKRDRPFDPAEARLGDERDGPIAQASNNLPAPSPVDSSSHSAVVSTSGPGDYKPLGQPRPTAMVQLLDYDQLFLREQKAFETRLTEVAQEIAKREVDHAAWVDYVHYRAVFGPH